MKFETEEEDIERNFLALAHLKLRSHPGPARRPSPFSMELARIIGSSEVEP